MNEIIDALIFKLNEKEVLPIELPRLIRDIMIIINNARNIFKGRTSCSMKQQ